MFYYFNLQFRRWGRMIRDWGVHPLVPIVALAVISIVAWKACETDSRITYGLAAAALLIPSYVANRSRSAFLKLNFQNREYLQIRALENLLAATLPLLILIANQEFLLAGAVLLLIILSTFKPLRGGSSLVIPSPFTRWPFEFTRGFRRSWPLYLIGVFLLIMAVKVENANLGLFALVIPFFLALSYYIEPEDAYFVWIHTSSPRAFLLNKMKIALIYSLALSLPMVVAHGLFFPDTLRMLLLIPLAGIVWVMTSLLAKYAHFPSELNLLQGFAVIFTIIFPPIGLLMIPVLFNKAKRNLENYLP